MDEPADSGERWSRLFAGLEENKRRHATRAATEAQDAQERYRRSWWHLDFLLGQALRLLLIDAVCVLAIVARLTGGAGLDAWIVVLTLVALTLTVLFVKDLRRR